MLLFGLFLAPSPAGSSPAPPVTLCNQIPFGTHADALVSSATRLTAMLCLQNSTQSKRRLDFELLVPPPLVPVSEDPALTTMETPEGWRLTRSVPLEVAGEKWFATLGFAIPPGTPPGNYTFVTRVTDADAPLTPVVQQNNVLQVVSEPELADLFTISPLSLPTNEMGEADSRRQPGTLLLRRHVIRFWQRLMEPDDPNKMAGTKPAAHCAVRIKSRASHPVTLMVRLDVLDQASGRLAPGFEIPFAEEHGIYAGDSGIHQILLIPAGGEETAILPLYTNDAQVLPGTYATRVKVSLFGGDVNFYQGQEPLRVADARLAPALATAFSLAIALAGMLVVIARRRQVFALPARSLILIAFFGAVTFAVVTIPGTLLFHAAHVILGPLSFLVTGFFNAVIFYILIIALLLLIPHFGAMSLMIAVRFLMSAFILGEFSPLSLLYYPTMAVLLEAAAWLSGMTGQRPKRSIPITAAIFGLGDAFLGLIFFNLSMFFYRLYYADWYIATYVLINGFAFTCLAVPFGFRLGRRLKGATHV